MMSRPLPQQPNIDHLKKQAKALLGDLRLENPNDQLADALHHVARAYGFATWPQLKAHVEALPHPLTIFVGRWVASVARSNRHPANPFRSAVMTLELDDNRIHIAHRMVDELGREDRGRTCMVIDDAEHALPNEGGYSLTATLQRPRTIETIAKKDGQIVDRGTYEVSADGSTLTVVGPEQTIVLERAV
jgi:hypothetical protein